MSGMRCAQESPAEQLQGRVCRALVVSSGGLIAMAIRVAMGLELGAFARLALTIRNTSVHQLHTIGSGLTLTQFNAVPHLEHPARRHARTFI